MWWQGGHRRGEGQGGHRAHPAVEQRVEHVVGGGLRPPLQDLRQEQELEQSTGLGSDPGVGGSSPHRLCAEEGGPLTRAADRTSSVSSGDDCTGVHVATAV